MVCPGPRESRFFQTRSVSGGGNWDVLHALVQERDPVPGPRIFEGGDSMDAMLGHG